MVLASIGLIGILVVVLVVVLILALVGHGRYY